MGNMSAHQHDDKHSEIATVIWLGDNAPLGKGWSSIELYHVQQVAAARRALQHGLAACLVIDRTLPDPDIEKLLMQLQQDWPYIGVIALVDPADDDAIATEPYTTISRFIDRTLPADQLAVIIHELAQQARWHIGSSDYRSLKDRARQLEGLVQGSLVMTHSPDDVLNNLRDVAQVAVDADRVAVLLTDDAYSDLSDVLGLGVPGLYLGVCREYFQALPAEERVFYLGDEVLLRERVPDMLVTAQRVREAEAAGAWSYMRFPIVVDGQLIGFVALFSDTPGRFNGAHLQLGRLFAAQVATAIRNRRFFFRLNRAELYQQSVSEVARLLAENLELDEVLNHIVREATILIEGRAGSVRLVQPDRSLRVGASYLWFQEWESDPIPPGVGQAGMIAVTGQPSVVLDYATWPHSQDDMRDKFPADAILLGIPLTYRSLVLGVLQVIRGKDVQGDPQEALDALLLLAPSAATAIAKAQLHEAIQHERRQLKAILDHTDAAVVMCDARGRVRLINPQAERVIEQLGLSINQVRDKSVVDLMHDLLPDDVSPLVQVPRAIEVQLGPLGEYVVNIAPIKRTDGEVDGYVGVAQNVTEVRQVDRMKSNLNRVLTHDLGNLIMLAQNPVMLMDEPDLTPDQRESLKSMLAGSLERMRALIQDVMDLEMVPIFDHETVVDYDLRELAEQAVERNQPAAKKKSIRLTYEEGTPVPALEGYTVLIMQAIDNLVSNAVKYTPEGGEIKVISTVEDNCAVVRIRDNGFGIPGDKLADIFEPFVRIKDERTRNIQGTGLGLNLVKTFVETHGGHVAVESQVDVGSTFTIQLPLDRSEANPASSPIIQLDLSKLGESRHSNGSNKP